ncbi:MAG: lactate utilization protein [Bacteroidales bacterium]|nr:lactate utilization protein [Bacteroidales bacterium]
MEESTSKEKVLKAVREAIISKTDQPYPKIDLDKPVFREMEESMDITFAQELTAAGANFIYCEHEREVAEGIRYLMNHREWEKIYARESRITELLANGQIPFVSDQESFMQAYVAMTGCEFLVARLGSVMVSTMQLAGRRIFVYPEIHIVLANTSQLVRDIKDALIRMKKKYEQRMPSMITLITGPSRTADIEKTLVMGAHGPRELYVFLLEDRN